MISSKAVTVICLGAALCMAQTINISGIVIDTDSVGISGAAVELENIDISTTTGSDGSFTLTNDSVQIQYDVNRGTIAASPVQLQNGTITVNVSETAPVAIGIYDVGGRQIYNHKKTYGSGTHAIKAPPHSTGIFLFCVRIGNEVYSFKSSSFGTFSTEQTVVSSGNSPLVTQAKATELHANVISVVNEGQLNYRGIITTYDTSGIVIRMIPNAGNVTDADGNVYQSVKIGNHVWTVENLKTTRYNDGTDIPHVTEQDETGGWTSLSTGAYCYYDNNAAHKDKFGVLYNWYAANSGKLAPDGWRVPSAADWDSLHNYLIANGYNWDGSIPEGDQPYHHDYNKIGKALAAQTDWPSSSTAGTVGNDPASNNSTGFSGILAGHRGFDPIFDDQGTKSFWWSATEYEIPLYDVAVYNRIVYDSPILEWNAYFKFFGFSVRLVRDSH